MRRLTIKLTLVGMLCFVGCGKYGSWGEPPLATMQLGLDGVKLIERGETRGDLPGFYNQDAYQLDPGRRLLLRFEAFSSEVERVNIEGTNKVWLEITALKPEIADLAVTALQLCPLTRPWMMLATWDYGHPFGGAGRWNEPGGDRDLAGCMAPVLKEAGEAALRFDVTKWFSDYPRGRGENFGFVLIATSTINLHGDRSGSFAPRFFFDSYTPSFVR